MGRYYANAAGDLATGGNVLGTLSVDTGGDGDFADIRGNDMLDFFGVFGGGDDEVDFVNNIVRDQACWMEAPDSTISRSWATRRAISTFSISKPATAFSRAISAVPRHKTTR